MENKKKIFFLIIFVLVIIIIILLYRSFVKIEKTDNAINEIYKENIIVKNTTGNIKEIIDNNEITNQVFDDSNKNSTDEIRNDNLPNNENKLNKEEKVNQIENVNTISTFDENAFVEGHLREYPNFGTNYATLKINKIGVNAPIYFGATDEIILQGVGHDSESYLPGENGTIIMCEHNYMNGFEKLGELVNGDIVEVQTAYGIFYYKIYDEKIVLETEKDKLPIQNNEELLMIYTCYPSNNTEHTPYRYVIYAKKV